MLNRWKNLLEYSFAAADHKCQLTWKGIAFLKSHIFHVIYSRLPIYNKYLSKYTEELNYWNPFTKHFAKEDNQTNNFLL